MAAGERSHRSWRNRRRSSARSPSSRWTAPEQPALNRRDQSRSSVSQDHLGLARCEARFENWGAPLPAAASRASVLRLWRDLVRQEARGHDGRRQRRGGGLHRAHHGESRRGFLQPPGWPEIAVLADDPPADPADDAAHGHLRGLERRRRGQETSPARTAGRPTPTHAGPTHKVLVQVAQSDLAFLRERAAAIDAQVWIEDQTLKFKSRRIAMAAT